MFALRYFTLDPKARFFFSALAWFPVGITFGILHLFLVMYAHPWMNTPSFLFPASLLILYLFGWSISCIKAWVTRRRFRTERQRLRDALSASDRDFDAATLKKSQD
jgi:hypothetical protein